MAKENNYIPSEPWFDEDGRPGAMSALEEELQAHGGWAATNNPRVREFVAREHLDGDQSVAQVARDHELPASRIKKWIDTYRAQGRAGLESLSDKTA